MKYIFIEKEEEYPVAKWAEILKIERTGYYAWRKRKEAHLKEQIKKTFEENRGIYGSDRIVACLRKQGERIGRNRCARYMAEMGLDSCHNRKRTRSLTNSKKARGEGYPNILRDKEFPIAPRMGVTSDITYLRTDEGFMYYCVIKDIVTKEVLGDYMSDRMTKELVIKAILSMVAKHTFPEGCIFHDDRGSQYTSKAVMDLLLQLGFRQSFSRVGMPGDNAWSESFFATLKKELIHRTHYATKEEVRTAVFEYIYCFYNGQRIQEGLDYLSPHEYFKSLRIAELEDIA